jgi:hypothetical protein
MTARTAGFLALALALSGVGTAAAQSDYTGPWERGSLQLGGFISTTNSEFQLNSETLGAGAVVDLENGLGIDADYRSFRVDAFYRTGQSRRHQWELHYYESNRDGERVLDQDYQIGDTVFTAGTGVTSNLDLWFANANYSYAFLQDDRVRLSGSVGVHTTGIKFEVSAPGLGEEAESVTAPLPVLGARFDVVLSERWRFKSSLDVFYLAFDNYRGALLDSSLAVEYLAFKNVGFGLGFNAVRYRVEADEEGGLGGEWNGEIRYDFAGALLYAKLYF